jgi:curved DNA-binding protein CbpA
MTALNGAWSVLSDQTKRAAYDRERRLRNGNDRWDGSAGVAPELEHGFQRNGWPSTPASHTHRTTAGSASGST